MNRNEIMVAQLIEIFSQQAVQVCLESETKSYFYICEGLHDNEKSFIMADETEKGFKVINVKQKTIYHLPTDHCFLEHLATYQGKRSDCIIFDDTHFCFVELKLDVTSHRKAADEAGEARDQLGAVIEYFKKSFQTASKDFLGYNLEAFVVMQQKIYPRHRARLVPLQKRFKDMYGVELFEKSEKAF